MCSYVYLNIRVSLGIYVISKVIYRIAPFIQNPVKRKVWITDKYKIPHSGRTEFLSESERNMFMFCNLSCGHCSAVVL